MSCILPPPAALSKGLVSSAVISGMIELPFGPGAAAALTFLLFELVLFPVLISSTTKAASLLLHKRSKGGQKVVVETLQYPLWNEGLLLRQWSHVLLFVARIICIVVPVYLGTRLNFRESPIQVERRLQTAYTLKPITDWVQYSLQQNVPIQKLRDKSELIYDRCAHIGEDNWIIASIANVTLSSNNEIIEVGCMPGTSKRVYQSIDHLLFDTSFSLSMLQHPSMSVSFSYVEGALKEIEPSLTPELMDPNLHVRKALGGVHVENTDDVKCFLPTLQPDAWAPPDLICHRMSQSAIDLYYLFYREEDIQVQPQGTDFSTSVGFYHAQVNGTLRFLGHLKFEKDTLISARHIVNEGSFIGIPRSPSSLRDTLRAILFTRALDVRVQIPGPRSSTTTLVDDTVLAVGGAEALLILAFGAGVQLWLLRGRAQRVRQAPNTMAGLSRCWAHSLAGANGGACARGGVTLTLRSRGGTFLLLPAENGDGEL